MLVLSRQRDETIMIGDDIEVTVVDIRGDKVRLGITAPKEIAVHRKEVYEAIKRENRAAAQVKPEDLPNFGKPGAAPKQAPHPGQRPPAPKANEPRPSEHKD
jgi:carbon storage regulator